MCEIEDIKREEYVPEECSCGHEDCERCDPDWSPGIDTCDEESDYDSDDSMDDIYEDCGLSRSEKKILQDELNYLIEQAETCCPNCQAKAEQEDELPPDPIMPHEEPV